MKLAIITSGFLPVPATKGGAVENIVMNLVNTNESFKKIHFTIFSIYDKEAKKVASNYKNTEFIFIKPTILIKCLDKIIFFISKKILRKKNSHSYRYILQRLFYLKKVSKYLHKSEYDKVLLENHPTQFLALKKKKNYIKYNGKYYYHCHNEIPGSYGCEDIIKKTNKIICVSNYRKKTVEEYFNLENERLCVLKNSIDTSTITKKATKQELELLMKKHNIKKNQKIALYVGRIVPGKGIKEILLSLKHIENKNIKLLILGSSINSLKVKTKYEEEINNIIDKDIEEMIEFTGFIKYEELYKYYSLADFAVLPSTLEDSAPLSVIESLCCGLPIITTNSGGIPEYVNHDSAIILNKEHELVNQLANSLDKLSNDEKLINNMSKAAKKASKDYTLEQYYKSFINIINN